MDLGQVIVLVTLIACVTGVCVALIEAFKERALPPGDAKAILAERFANGEIDADEYADRLSVLELGPPLRLP